MARVADAETQAAITKTFANRPGVFWPTDTIATRRRCVTAAARPAEQRADDRAASNYVMMTLVEFDDPGLLLLLPLPSGGPAG